MSNATAIAAVTGALYKLLGKIATLQSALSDLRVTASPLDQNGSDTSHNALNIFLYRVAPNAAWRNVNVPRQPPAGTTASPAPDMPYVALDLHYLITVYGKGDDDTLSHLILGQAMSLLADNACVSPDLLRQATVNSAITGIDLHQQVDRVRLTPEALSMEEMSKLWSISNPKYRISVGYQASVVLIEGFLPRRAPLPVLSPLFGATTGQPPFPTLTGITLPGGRPSARLGDTITLVGFNLGGSNDNLAVEFSTPLQPTTLFGTVISRSATAITVQIPNTKAAQTTWPAGLYLVRARRDDPPVPGQGTPPRRSTNALALTLAPTIKLITPPPPGTNIVVDCSPAVWREQSASLLIGDREIPVVRPTPTPVAPMATLSFPAAGLSPGTYFVRLRVDDVDSLLVDYSQNPPIFDLTQRVTLP